MSNSIALRPAGFTASSAAAGPWQQAPCGIRAESGYRRRAAISVLGSFTSKRPVASATAASTSVASTMPIYSYPALNAPAYMSCSVFEEAVRTR